MQMNTRRAIRKKIGELLIERGVITSEQLDQALAEQAQKGGYISQHLISMGFAKDADIAQCLSVQYNMGYIPLGNYSIPKHLLDIVPLKLIKIFSIVPLDRIGNLLTIAMADPLNEGVVEMLRNITDCDIEVLISTYSELSSVIDKYFAKQIEGIGKYAISEDELIKEGVARSFVQTAPYSGQERRRYRRIEMELDMEYFLYGKNFKARIKNISYVGIYFVSSSFIHVDTNILCKINIKNDCVDVIVQIVRVERRQEGIRSEGTGKIGGYGIAGFFNFLTDADKRKLIKFLEGQDKS